MLAGVISTVQVLEFESATEMPAVEVSLVANSNIMVLPAVALELTVMAWVVPDPAEVLKVPRSPT